MHEYSLCRDLIHRVCDYARQEGWTSLRTINLHIGTEALLDADCLCFYFDICKMETIAAEAQLVITPINPHAQCQQCGLQQSIDQVRAEISCDSCGSIDLMMHPGKEMRLYSIEGH